MYTGVNLAAPGGIPIVVGCAYGFRCTACVAGVYSVCPSDSVLSGVVTSWLDSSVQPESHLVFGMNTF